ncbi:Uu.00g104700.m01.CDS01 [Anthostomella pinea]|uniref:Uu.00g104700.m01.CDS01 n=1 Tax=Anthostomella pinea TaxID=933095 RepID=A0AAI8VDU5_9PEZI|nr:Uu.00g104700.m01.CDS01 [Anthostomella pinea]
MAMSQGASLVEKAVGHDGSSITAQDVANYSKTGDPSETMKALCWMGKNTVEVRDVPRPKIIEPNDVILKVTGSTVCGSDLHLLHGSIIQLNKGDILGHEFCGIADEMGSNVKNIQKGKRYVASFQIACGDCFQCKQKLSSQCERTNSNTTERAMYGGQTAGMFGYSHFTGGFAGGQAEYVRVPLGNVNLLEIPEDVPDEKALYLSDVLPTSYNAVHDTAVYPGDQVAIWGAGPIGHMAGFFAADAGASKVIFVDTEPRLTIVKERWPKQYADKIELIDYKKLSFGATNKPTVVSTLKEMCGGRGPDAAIEVSRTPSPKSSRRAGHANQDQCVAGEYAKGWMHWAELMVGAETDTSEIINEMIESVRNFGRCGITGVYVGYTNHFNVGSLMERGIRLIGNGQAPVHKYWEDLLERIKKGDLDPLQMVSHRARVEDLDKLYYAFEKKEDGMQKVFVETKFSLPPLPKKPLEESMYEKQPRASEGPLAEPRKGLPARWRWSILGLLLCLAILYSRIPQTWLPPHERSSQQCHNTSTQFSYPGETILWEPCGDLKGRPLECSSIDVPMDQFSAESPGNKTFSVPLMRQRGLNATQNLLLNPGGPGASGLDHMHRRGELLRTIVGEGFHLLTFDPRGVGGSRPLATCYPDRATRRELLAPVRDFMRVLEDSAEVWGWTRNFVRACAETMGEHAAYLDTPQTAADLNSVLDAVGQRELVYWGFSYGSLLGQTYAGLYPERVGRVIVDGVEEQFSWYNDLFGVTSLVDTDTVFDGFLEECVKAGRENCPLSSVASSKEELHEKIMRLADGLKEQPLSVHVNSSVYGLLSYETLLYRAIFPQLWKPATWHTLAEVLAQWLQGNATAAFLTYGHATAARAEVANDADRIVALNDGRTGPAHWPGPMQGRAALLDKLVPYMNRSLFSPTENAEFYARQQWPIRQTHTYAPQRHKIETAHPLLILSTTWDPVCPLASAQAANAAFSGSRIVEVRGYGHCSIAVPSVSGAARAGVFV